MTILQRAAAVSREVETNAKTTAFAQWAIALVHSKKLNIEPVAAFRTLYPRSVYLPSIESDVERHKAAVAAGATDNWGAELLAPQTLASAFIAALRPLTVLGRLAGARHVPVNVKIPRQTTGAAVGWVGETKPIPASALALDVAELAPYKVAGIVFASRELVTLSSPDAAGLVRDDLLAGVAAFEDAALLDPSAVAVAGVSPASITFGAPTISASGSIAETAVTDIGRLLDALYGSNLVAPYFITRPRTAARLGSLQLASGGGFAFPGLGPNGGQILGIPVLTTTALAETETSPQTSSLVLIDAAELIVADGDQVALDIAANATVQADTAPDDPAVDTTVFISLWQQNLLGWRVVRPVNWLMRRPGAVAVLTGL